MPSTALQLRSKRPTLKPGEVEVRVEAIGLNFRDVLNASWLAHLVVFLLWQQGHGRKEHYAVEPGRMRHARLFPAEF